VQKDISKPETERPTEAQKPPKSPKAALPSPSSTGGGSLIGVSAAYCLDTYNLTADASSGSSYDGDYAYSLAAASISMLGKYFQVDIGYATTLGGTYSYTNTSGSGSSGSTALTDDMTYLTFGAYARLPFRLGAMELFPLAGVEYDLNMTYTDENGYDKKSSTAEPYYSGLNHLYLKAGIGAIFDLGKLAVCPEIAFGWKVKSEADTADESTMVNVNGWNSSTAIETKLDVGLVFAFRL
jgi:hypothetical protein